jgi:hypothetical protein
MELRPAYVALDILLHTDKTDGYFLGTLLIPVGAPLGEMILLQSA